MFTSINFRSHHPINRLWRTGCAFHEEETGAGASTENLLILFAGVFLLLGLVKTFFPHITENVTTKVNQLLGININSLRLK